MTGVVPGPAVPAQQQFRAVPGETGIVVHTWKLPIAFGIGTKVAVNGYPIPNTKWGANFVPGPPGVHTVAVDATQWGTAYGGNFAQVQVFPGHTTEVHYTAPAQIFMKGALAAERQPAPGAVLSYVAMVFVVIVIAAYVALIVM
ncbi:hypothetical protein ACFV24_31815 [Nocardia fluminea]|uniref:hypothetical protein n=1 Tax=Nocardia fluminea TaxID=134984 RepID=UPI0033C90C3F